MRSEPSGTSAFARVFSLAGGLLFAFSLGYFFFQYLTRFGRIEDSGDWATAATWNAVLFTGFAFHHSLFAREPVRQWIRSRLSSDVERSAYVWVASLLFLIVCATWRPLPGLAWQADGALAWLLRAAQAFGVWLTLRSAGTLGIRVLAGLPAGAQGTRTPGPAPPEPPIVFKTTGPYGWVRHPIYSAWFLLVFCVSTMTLTRLEFAAISSAYLLVAIPFEERTLRTSSGGAYDEYSRRVPWKLLPGIY